MNSVNLGVVLLNWNGLQDTLDCLSSIYSLDTVPSQLVLVDNGSTDASVAAVRDWVRSHPLLKGSEPHEAIREGRTTTTIELNGVEDAEQAPGGQPRRKPRLVIIENGKNLGFSAGNNIGIQFLLERGIKYVMLLNNDTILTPEAFADLVNGMEGHPQVQCMVPQIRYWGAQDRIWNCGGKWTWFGVPRYHFAGQGIDLLEGKAPFPVSFVTGCALIIRANWLEKNGLLCERFFFGEEDVEFSWRMRTSGKQTMYCWPHAVIYHKVGVSITKMADNATLPKIYGHYLNRMIFLKMSWGKGLRWHLRRVVVLAYFGWILLSKFKFTIMKTIRILRDLVKDSSERTDISASFFSFMMKEKFSMPTQGSSD